MKKLNIGSQFIIFICSACPPNWPKFENNCYRLFNVELTWAEANIRCQWQNGYLASILSEEENQFIVDHFVGDYYFWIGGSDLKVENSWTWTDGSPWNYTDWSTGQPEEANGDTEHCLNMFSYRRKGKWNDLICTYKKMFLCKITN